MLCKCLPPGYPLPDYYHSCLAELAPSPRPMLTLRPKPAIALELLPTALLRLDPTGSWLTSHHCALVELAYTEDRIEPILPIIQKTPLFFQGMKGSVDLLYPGQRQREGGPAKLTSEYVMRYDIVSGLCFMRIEQWKQAFNALERVVTYPTQYGGCSKMQVEAHNKWLLLGLLVNGKTPTVPSTAGAGAIKNYDTIGKPYRSLCKAFENRAAHALKAEFESLGPDFFKEEGNLGLVRRVMAHYQRWQILKLRHVYTKISLDEIRQRTQSAETAAPLATEAEVERLVQAMIDEGMLAGRIEKPAGPATPAYLHFLPTEADRVSDADFELKMRATQQRILALAPVVDATMERLATSREYTRHVITQQRKDAMMAKGIHFDASIEDEDLMNDIMSGL